MSERRRQIEDGFILLSAGQDVSRVMSLMGAPDETNVLRSFPPSERWGSAGATSRVVGVSHTYFIDVGYSPPGGGEFVDLIYDSSGTQLVDGVWQGVDGIMKLRDGAQSIE